MCTDRVANTPTNLHKQNRDIGFESSNKDSAKNVQPNNVGFVYCTRPYRQNLCSFFYTKKLYKENEINNIKWFKTAKVHVGNDNS